MKHIISIRNRNGTRSRYMRELNASEFDGIVKELGGYLPPSFAAHHFEDGADGTNSRRFGVVEKFPVAQGVLGALLDPIEALRRAMGGRKRLEMQPIAFAEACEFVKQHHRHHVPPQGHKFSIAVADDEQIVGVIMVGRPVARAYDNGRTLEVTRCCTDGSRNAASMLYAAAWKAARALGYRRIITYTLAEEPGTSLRASGWKVLHQTRGGSWNSPSRPRIDKHPTGQKTLWELA